jgi:hypothetical protein
VQIGFLTCLADIPPYILSLQIVAKALDVADLEIVGFADTDA